MMNRQLSEQKLPILESDQLLQKLVTFPVAI